MIVMAVVTFTPQTVFPSYNAMLPCLGAALVIHCGRDATAGRIFSNRAMVGIGLISYSVYLIHWPLIVLYRYWKFAPLDVGDQVGVVVISVMGAIAMYAVVETPFRKRLAWRRSTYAAVAACLAVIRSIPAMNAAQTGWPWRTAGFYPPELQNREVTLLHNREKACRIENADKIIGDCRESKPRTILIMGDSHADAWYYAFSQLMPDTKIVLLSYLGCDGAMSVEESGVHGGDTRQSVKTRPTS